MKIKKYISISYLWITLFYFVTRLTNILKLPIFNDEAIYIDWGFKELNSKGNLFYSLYDSKPPLLMWIFGLSSKLFTNPLLSARLVSVAIGFLSLVGIYKLGKKYFNEQTAIFSSILYIVIPIFAFYDRQTLMESAVLCIGIWSIYLFLDFIKDSTFKNALLLGSVWGVGIFTKQSTLVFIISQVLIYFWLTVKSKSHKFNWHIFSVFYISQIVLIPLYLQKDFWGNLYLNSRFTLGINEIIKLPFAIWLKNLESFSLISFWYISLPIIILAFLGIIKTKTIQQKILATSFLISFIVTIIFSRTLSPRYAVSFLPFMVIFASHYLTIYKFKKNIFRYIWFVLVIAYPAFLTFLLITNPLKYFAFLNKFTNFSGSEEYVSGWTSGYGVIDAVNYIKSNSSSSKTIVGIRVDAGNPESAVFAYFEGSENITPQYFDAKYIDPKLLNYACIKDADPFYFVARDGNLAGMDKFLVEDKVFPKPIGTNFVSVYKLKKCE